MSNVSAAKENMQNAKNEGQQAAGSALEGAKNFAQAAGQKASDAAHFAGQKAGEMANVASQKAGEMAHAVSQQADSAKNATGDGIKSFGRSIESGGDYLKNTDFQGILGDVGEMIKRNPLPAVLLGVGLGFLLAAAVRRS
jgi:hypothetical protein